MLQMNTALQEQLPTLPEGTWLPPVALAPEKVRAVLISEAPHEDPAEGFYGKNANGEYLQSVKALFAEAGQPIEGYHTLTEQGIYITTAVKQPKSGYDVPTGAVKRDLPILQAELALFPNLAAILLCGDVARKAYDAICRAETGKRCIPAGSTYKLRKQAWSKGPVRVFPSYIITGGNILIEKSKRTMICEDLRTLHSILTE